jgi:energy-coupling factor transporter ATP-binding protein EcfA2
MRTFDAHCIEELDQPERITHVKMTDVGLKGLSAALRFPDTRIRFSESLPSSPVPFIRGLQIEGGERALFPSLTLGFVENLNCLIGARGSGKSSVVEALRYIFGYNRTLDRIEPELRRQVGKLQESVLPDSLLRVLYHTAEGEDLVLEATFDLKSSYATKVFTMDGEPVSIADVEACGKFPLRLFGWSEIETLGRSPQRQRELLDLLTPGLRSELKARADIRDDLATNRVDIEKIIKNLVLAFGKGGGEIRRYREYDQDFTKLNTTEVKDLFLALDTIQLKKKVLGRVRENTELKTTDLVRMCPAAAEPKGEADSPDDAPKAQGLGGSLTDGTQEVLSEGDAALSQWWKETETGTLNVSETELAVTSLLTQANAKLIALQGGIDREMKILDGESLKLEAKLREELSTDADLQRTADLRKNADERLTRVRSLRKNYMEEWKNLKAQLDTRKCVVEKLAAAQERISGIRTANSSRNQQQLNRLLPNELKIGIEVGPGKDVSEYEEKLLRYVKAAPQYKAKGLHTLASRAWNPVEFASVLKEGGLQQPALDFPFAEKITDATKPFGMDEDASVPVLLDEGKRLMAILELEEVPWDDLLVIRLNGRPIDQVSPGQRSSAMLPLIALVESTPLLIDQPEDNLDKRLIGQALAAVLAELKEKRQIIVCTHDPNIVVGGDAEQVIVLEAVSDRKARAAEDGHGAIDTPAIVGTVIDLLEGGKAAFEAREKRYSVVGVGARQ